MLALERKLIYEDLDVVINGIGVQVSVVRRDGELPPIIFLHGFGSSKEDYVDLAIRRVFSGRPFVAFDAPGCGATVCHDLSQISIPFQVATAHAVIERLGIQRFHLAGHSMGGLGGLLLAHQEQDRVISFINIKGNLAPEDCFLSRQIFTFPSDDPRSFMDAFTQRARSAPSYSSALYSASLEQKVKIGAVRGIFESMVELSDQDDLLGKFLTLPYPRMYMYGEEYEGLSYLKKLAESGVELAVIPDCGHFPMYSNPVEMWKRIALFVDQVELSIAEI